MRRHVMCLVTVLLLVPSTASAVTTSVTGVTAGGISRFIVDVSNPPIVHFTGTADVASVDLKCVSSQAGGGFSALTIADNVTVTSMRSRPTRRGPRRACARCSRSTTARASRRTPISTGLAA